MVLRPVCPVFYVGAPQPIACRVPALTVEPGAERECVSAQGVVSQRITEAETGRRLAFRMESTELAFSSCVTHLSDEFELTATGDGTATTIVRTTRVRVRGLARAAKYAMLFVALKAVQRFVFRNWAAVLGGRTARG
jgi:hypothetical protein